LADLVLAPSQHFAELAMRNNVSKVIEVLPNGVDDKFALTDLALPPKLPHTAGQPVTLLWCGRISAEKRIMTFLEAMKMAKVNAIVKIYGSGTQLDEAMKYVEVHKLGKKIKFMGRLSHNDMLLEMREVDIMVQTSVGFETQGMTVYEAGVMGTPSIICDHNIAGDIPKDSYWLVADESAEALARTITEACQDVEQNRSKVIDLRAKMLQSKITELQVDYYKKAIRAHSARRK
jgi:glycosyltransferase involved in cell wall biosynthesis